MNLQEFLPYCGEAPHPGGWLAHWNFDPALVAVLGLLLGLAIRHRARLRFRPALAALGVMAAVYISPFCALGSALFTVRVVHDVVLVAVLAPLIVAALRAERATIGGSVAVWTAIHALTFWLWHAPPLYAQAMSRDIVFWLMQITLTGTAAIWWVKIIRAQVPTAVAALLATMVAMGALGALLTFAHRAYYAVHWLSAPLWGLSPLEDQQIAGIVMWAPASLLYLLASLTIIYRSLGREVRA